jgi:hypothetical protein
MRFDRRVVFVHELYRVGHAEAHREPVCHKTKQCGRVLSISMNPLTKPRSESIISPQGIRREILSKLFQ